MTNDQITDKIVTAAGNFQIKKASEFEYIVMYNGKDLKSYKSKRECLAFIDGYSQASLSKN